VAQVTWDRLETSHVTAEFALQRGMSMLDAAVPGDPATLAWWFVDDDALVLGRGSKVSADAVACDAAGVSVVRRASGGGPVLWGSDLLALDVIIPTGHPRYSDDVAESYRWLGEALARTITGFGVPARALPPGEARDAAGPMGALACFASLSPWEVIVDERKVVGLSQVRRRTGTLLQAGILLDIDGARLAGLLQLDVATRSALTDTLARGATGLRDQVDIDRVAFIAALTAAITDAT
jgi:lipoate---protein ligase